MGDGAKKIRGSSLDTKVMEMMRVHDFKFKYDFDKLQVPVKLKSSKGIDFGLDIGR